MKSELEKYISEIFSTLEITEKFEVFDCESDVIPEWANQVSLTHEFLICCGQLSDKEKLQNFSVKNFINLKILFIGLTENKLQKSYSQNNPKFKTKKTQSKQNLSI